MRIAIISDIHGNRRAFQAVLADLRQVAPDLIVHGRDLADGGAHATEIIDQIRSLGWLGVQAPSFQFAPRRLAGPYSRRRQIPPARLGMTYSPISEFS